MTSETTVARHSTFLVAAKAGQDLDRVPGQDHGPVAVELDRQRVGAVGVRTF